MGDRTGIEWTEATWNPVTGCTKVSPGCDHCYAEGIAHRFAGTKAYPNGFEVTLRPERLDQPLRWRRPRRIFVNSMSDLFHKDVPDEYIAKVFAVMAAAPRHTFQILTKRHGRMRSLLSGDRWLLQVGDAGEAMGLLDHRALIEGTWPLPNVWCGVSVEDQRWADIRIPALLETPAAVRFISAEPLLGPVQLQHEWLAPRAIACWAPGHEPSTEDRAALAQVLRAALRQLDRKDPSDPAPTFLDWVIVGGESGPGARAMHPDWARTLRDQCQAAGVPFLFKQWGEYAVEHESSIGGAMKRVGKKAAGRELDGRTWDEYPVEATR